MAVCGVLVLCGLVVIALWGGIGYRPPADGGGEAPAEPAHALAPGLVARRYVWYLAVAVGSGVGAGILMAGTGGRLAMRLLAVTAGDAAQGRRTEAEEVVGRITLGGTFGLVVFTALFFGSATGVLYLVLRRWLPAGRLGGLTYGLLLLVVAAPRVDPLRADNPDFDIVGPGWLSLAVFAALVVAHGMLVVALAGRYSRALPLIGPSPRRVLGYAPVLLLLPLFPVLIAAIILGGLVVLATRMSWVAAAVGSRRTLIAGWAVLALITALSLPGLATAVSEIAAGPG